MVKRICFAAMTVLVMLSACGEASQQESPAEDALEQYRNMAGAELAARVSCTWNGEAREYLLDCTYVPEGESKVEVQEPEELAGLTAVVDGETLSLRYEGDCLDAGTISDEGISPAACLPRLLDALRTGWLLEENEEKWGETDCLRLTVDDAPRAAMILQTRLGTDKFEVLPGNVIELYDCLDRPQAVSGALSAGGVALLGMEQKGADLEAYFLNLIGGGRNG